MTPRRARKGKRVSRDAGVRESQVPPWLSWWAVVLAALAMYAPTLGIPFLGDDYIFLDKTRLAGFLQLWSRSNVDFGWYRPWSRELHFWTIQHLVGVNPQAFRAVGLALWITSLLLFGRLVRRLSDEETATVAVAGLASLGLWGTPVMWISGSQDLWMFFFITLALLCVVAEREWLALPAYAGALVSKETAAVFPLLAACIGLLAQRRPLREVVLRVLSSVALTVAWLAVHPTLLGRLVHGSALTPSAEHPLAPWEIAAKTALAMVNADQLGDALLPTPRSVMWLGIGGLLLGVAVWFRPERSPIPPASRHDRRLAALGAGWAAAGWAPLFLPSIGWHAYYGCLGAAGAWLAGAALLHRRRTAVVAVLLLVTGLRLFNTSSRTWDWGSEWYQRRAGAMVGGIQTQLMARYPTLPQHTRVYFGSVPNNIGLVAGSSPAVRVWYRDSTLRAGFYSYYRPRAAGEAPGRDLFFHFDSTRGLVEVKLGPEDVARAVRTDPGWERNHESLAITLLRAGDPARAAEEFEKIAGLASRPDAFMLAAVCREAAGDSGDARRLMATAAARTGGTPVEMERWARTLRAQMPRTQQAPGQR